MKPEVLHSVNFSIRQIDMKSINCKCCWDVEQNPKTTKNMLLKDPSPNKIKAVVPNFYPKLYQWLTWSCRNKYDFISLQNHLEESF